MAHGPKEELPGIKGWIEYRLPIFSFLDNSLGSKYPAPRNLNYFWNFGSMALICLIIQILSGLFLSMHYAANIGLAFDSVEHIMRDVNGGWLLRYMHAVGASMFFVVTYVHICRGLYYGSYKRPREILWWLGLVIFLIMMATAFMGYVLPWGQMSFWGATVITNLFSAIPVVGESIVHWLWGGFSVDNPTLNRFYSLHFLLPFVLVGIVVLHIWALHIHGSNNPLGIDVKTPQDTIPFHPYYTVKDSFTFGLFFMVFAWFVFFSPNSLGHPDNYIPANALVTPAHIVPEWYFLPYYAILRAVPDIGIPFTNIVFIESKLAGVIGMFGSIIIMFALPWIDRCKVRSADFRPWYKPLFWIFVINACVLGYMGAQSADGSIMGMANIVISRIALCIYFGFFVVLFFMSKKERTLPLPESIAQAVLSKNASAHH